MRNLFSYAGYLTVDNVSYAQTSSSHYCLVPRGWQGLHSPATARLPAILDFLCSLAFLDLLDHGLALPWYHRYVMYKIRIVLFRHSKE